MFMLTLLIVISNILLYLFYIASEKPHVYESQEFPGVTIIFRTSSKPKPLASVDTHGKTGTQGARRDSELHQTQFNM
jgi:hypothetical protein